jgi:hypothetical protein
MTRIMAVAVVLYSVWEANSVLPEIAKASRPRLVASSTAVEVRVLLIVGIPLVVLLPLTPLIARSFPEAIHRYYDLRRLHAEAARTDNAIT